MATDLRHAKVVELVCSSCGFRHCAAGVLMCPNARTAGVCTREEYERRHVELDVARQVLAVEFSGSFTVEDLEKLSPEQLKALYDGTGKILAAQAESGGQVLGKAAA